MELYLIRHGQSQNNALATPVGRTKDPSLTEIGLKQAQVLADHLANGDCPDAQWEKRDGYHFDRLYCSAMHRALQTAQPVADALGLQPEVWVDVHEQGGIYLDGDNGKTIGHPGMTRAEILDQFPGYVLPDNVGESGWWNRDFETIGGASGRAVAVAEILVERASQSNERVAIVSHGMFVNLLIKALLNQLPSPASYYHHFNTAMTRIDIGSDGFIILRYLNRINHLTPDLVTQ
ncbi:MAG: hypothetical protein CL610_23940 [Anaerolineaceae bacterium]|nr:hypothetical protein [Anaerolineaceae bacterium]